MKRTLSKLLRNETGQALLLVLILLALGLLIISPLMGYMSTGLKAGQVKEERIVELYAADAGVEHALWKIKYSAILAPPDTDFLTANDKDVTVVIELEEDLEAFLENLLGSDAGKHAEWAASLSSPAEGTYSITVTWAPTEPDEPGHENKKIEGVGAWLMGDYDIKYDVYGDPVCYGDLVDDYPDFDPDFDPLVVKDFRGGTAFIWRWKGADNPSFGKTTGVYTRTLTFEFTPVETPSFSFSWVHVVSEDIGVVPETFLMNIWKVTATAVDSATGKQTEVVSYVSGIGAVAPYYISVLTWEVSQQ